MLWHRMASNIPVHRIGTVQNVAKNKSSVFFYFACIFVEFHCDCRRNRQFVALGGQIAAGVEELRLIDGIFFTRKWLKLKLNSNHCEYRFYFLFLL